MSDGLASALAVFRLNVFNFGPTITSAAPSGDFELPHNTTRSVTVTAEDYEGDPLTYVWTLDGRVLPSTGPEAAVGPLVAGSFSLRLVVRDLETPVEFRWNVTAVNDPPVFLDISPAPGDLTVNALEDVTFSARAADPDGDPVVLQWAVDNAPRNVSGGLTTQWPFGGAHTVTVDAVSSGHVVTLRWNVTVVQVNAAPVLTAAAPNGTDVAVAVGSEGVFAVEFDDDGVLPLTITWSVDGVERGQGAGFVFRPTGSDVGSHEVRVRISDGEYSAERSWTVLVSEPAESTSTGGLGDMVTLLLGLAIGAGAAAGLFAVMRRRPKGGAKD